MLTTEPTNRTRAGMLLAALFAAFMLAACGDDETSDASGTEPERSDSDRPNSGEALGPQGGEMTADDGWLNVHDVEIPDPGQAWLRAEGHTAELSVLCDTNPIFAAAEWMLFSFEGSATGTWEDGREVSVLFSRTIVSADEAQASVWGRQESGSITVSTTRPDELFQSAVLVSPSDADPEGAGLPIVRVDDSGAFSVIETIEPLHGQDGAIAGPIEFAGRCQ